MSFQATLFADIATDIADHLRLLGREVRFYPLAAETSPDALWWRKFLKALFESGAFKPEDFRDAVIKGVRTCGFEMFHRVSRGEYPDHVESPEALAYILQSVDISPGVAGRIHFDHGETLEQFKSRADGLIGDILRQLSNL